MKYLTAITAVALCWLVLLGLGEPETAAFVPAPELPTTAQPARIVLLVYLDRTKDMPVAWVFENTSAEPFQYYESGLGERPVGGLAFRLFKDGQEIAPLAPTPAPAALRFEGVRTLKPKEQLRHTVDLKKLYPELKPGRYEAKASYHIPPGSPAAKDFGLTPLTLDQTICYVEVK